jgi:hypothetical protein
LRPMIFTTKLRKKQINTQLYHEENLGHWITGKTNGEEIQAYIGILIYMGLVNLAEIEDYFRRDLGVSYNDTSHDTKTIPTTGTIFTSKWKKT